MTQPLYQQKIQQPTDNTKPLKRKLPVIVSNSAIITEYAQ